MGFLNFLEGVGRQLNPLDNNATFKNPQGNGQTTQAADQVKNIGLNFVKGVASPFEYLAKTAIINPAKELATGTDTAKFHKVNQQSQEDLGLGPDGKNIGGALKKLAGNTAQIGLDFLAPAIAGKATELASGAIGLAAPDFAASQVANIAGRATLGGAETPLLNAGEKLIAGPLAGAAIGGPFNVAGAAANDQPLNASTIPHLLETGSLTGAALGLGAEGAGIAGSAAADAIKNASPLGTSGHLDIGALIKAGSTEDVKAVLKDELPQTVIDQVAPAIAQTKDPNIIQNIIDKASPPAPAPAAPISDVTPGSTTATAGQGSGSRDVSMVPEAQVVPPESPTLAEATVPPAPQASPEQQVIDSLNGKGGAIATRETQEAGYSAERSARIGSSQAAGANIPGEAGYNAEKAALKGELPKQAYTGISDKLAPAQQDDLFTQLRQKIKDNPNITGYQDLNTQTALHKVIYGDAGVPTRGEIKLLQNAFGDDFANTVQDNIKTTLGQKTFALWRTGLLTGPQTFAKVAVSHLVQAAFSVAKDYPSAIIDKIVSVGTGNRSVVAPGFQELERYGKGFGVGFGDAKEYMKSGIQTDPITGNSLEFQNNVHFQHQVFQNYTDWIGRAHASIPTSFSTGEAFRSLYNQASASALNEGLKGEAAQGFIADFIKDPPKIAADQALHEGQLASLQQETSLGKVASAIQQKGGILGKVIAPFTRVPSAIATDLVNYSPVGAVKTIIDGVKAARSDEGFTLADQRKFSQGLGQSITGSAAIVPGIMLYNKGILTLGYPTDPKEQKLWAEQGKIPNAIKIGGQWRSLGSLGPVGSVMSIGGHVADSLMQGKSLSQAVVDGFVGGAQSIEEQSYLRGASGAINAINDPGRYAGNFVNQTAGSVIPTAASTIAAATDPNQRATSSPLDVIQSRTPVLRNLLPTKTDALGNTLKAPETGIEKIIDPFQSSKATTPTPLGTELNRLQNAGQGVQPATVSKSLSFNNVKTSLSPAQVRELTANIGATTKKVWAQIISDPTYKQLPDELKQQVLNSIYSGIASQEKTKFAQKYNFGAFSPTYKTDRISQQVGQLYPYQQ